MSHSPSLPAPARDRSSQKDRSLVEKERNSTRTRSPSSRMKILRRAHAEKEGEKTRGREIERNYVKKGSEKERREREVGKERRSEVEGKSSSRGRHGGRSASPLGSNRRSRSKHRSSDDDNYDDSVSKMKAAEEALEAKQKKQSSFELSGKLAAETNRVRGITFLFIKPPYAKKPDIRWRLYVFKGGEALNEPLYIHRQSCYLFWRERRVVDIPTDHPSRSKKHAVIQFQPYMMDLGSTNKTFINDNPIEPQRYYELFEKDAIKFGSSCREYVQLHENSA
ncbi:hypothetical protein POPTR_011G136102v4 [Populus trichocarpa]|uniref:Retrotransposon gag domain-containing protein n=1 Tax=Populus trichocarpa TaxID=3694 RepID=B9I0Q2_POPTR|nr:hypothetical protein POPTR_011G136102v4 [Populus trichocarpa]